MTLLIIAVLAAVALVVAFYKVPWFNKWFKDSEIVAWAWLKGIGGIVGTGILAFDPTDFKNAVQAIVENIGLANWWPVALAGLGLLMYLLRTARDPSMKG